MTETINQLSEQMIVNCFSCTLEDEDGFTGQLVQQDKIQRDLKGSIRKDKMYREITDILADMGIKPAPPHPQNPEFSPKTHKVSEHHKQVRLLIELERRHQG